MAELPSYFSDFLRSIRPTQSQREKMRDAHRELRERLEADEKLKPLLVATFIQGSYRRFTANRPQNDDACDVDIVVATNLDEKQTTPRQALERFRPFLKEHYEGKYQLQGRSWGIKVDQEVALDLVPTSAPSEVQEQAMAAITKSWDFPIEPVSITANAYDDLLTTNNRTLLDRFELATAESSWKNEPLRIPDREADIWEDTHPLEQIRWTRQKNAETNGHYVNVVKAIKWWRRLRVSTPSRPKSYPLEHMIGDCCPIGITSVAEGVTRSLEEMESAYRPYVNGGKVPFLGDRGVPSHNVLHRVTADDFGSFLDQVRDASQTARDAIDAETVKQSADLWRKLFGDEFPASPDDDDNKNGNSNDGGKGFTQRTAPSQIQPGRFA